MLVPEARRGDRGAPAFIVTRRVTMDVAAALGVSTATVSRALKDSPASAWPPARPCTT